MALLPLFRSREREAELEHRVHALQTALAQCKGVARSWWSMRVRFTVAVALVAMAAGFALGVYRHPIKQAFVNSAVAVGFASPADAAAEAETAFQKTDYAKALRLARPLAEDGDPRAEAVLGSAYYRGRGVAQNDGEVVSPRRRQRQRRRALHARGDVRGRPRRAAGLRRGGALVSPRRRAGRRPGAVQSRPRLRPRRGRYAEPRRGAHVVQPRRRAFSRQRHAQPHRRGQEPRHSGERDVVRTARRGAEARARVDAAVVAKTPSPAGLIRGSIFFAKTFCETDGLPGQARQ